jgi:CheY-like chemotaxis protein
MAEEHHKCRDAGMVDLVVKPIELEALVAAVRKHLPSAV